MVFLKITNEDIKAVQSQVDVTYEEAERFLIKSDGDIERAVTMINRKRDSSFSKFIDETKRIGAELLTYYFKIEKKDKIYMNIPLILVVLFFVFVNVDTKIWILVVGIGLILISESQVSIYKSEKEEEDLMVKKDPSEAESKEGVSRTPKADQSTQSNEATHIDKRTIDTLDIETPDVTVTDNPMSEKNVTAKSGDDEDDDYYEITIEK